MGATPMMGPCDSERGLLGDKKARRKFICSSETGECSLQKLVRNGGVQGGRLLERGQVMFSRTTG